MRRSDVQLKVINLDGRRNVSGERVRQVRTRKRLTQADLAARVQTTGVILEQDAISRIESGSRMVQDYELRALAEVLGVTADWLMEDDENNYAVGFISLRHFYFQGVRRLTFCVFMGYYPPKKEELPHEQ